MGQYRTASLSEQSADLQTVDRLHVHEAVGGDVVSVDGTVQDSQGLNSIVPDSERQSQLPQNGTSKPAQWPTGGLGGPLTQESSGGGDRGDGGVQPVQPNTAQHNTVQTDSTEQTEGSEYSARQTEHYLLLVSSEGNAEYDAPLGLSAGQRVQPASLASLQDLSASLGPLRGESPTTLLSSSSSLCDAQILGPSPADLDGAALPECDEKGGQYCAALVLV